VRNRWRAKALAIPQVSNGFAEDRACFRPLWDQYRNAQSEEIFGSGDTAGNDDEEGEAAS
jgi:hypothetical protein